MSDVLEKLARERFIERSIAGMAGSAGERPEDLQDLAQDLYLELLEKDLTAFETEPDLRYYILKMISNNLNSKTSRYFYKYKANDKRRDERDIGGIPSE